MNVGLLSPKSVGILDHSMSFIYFSLQGGSIQRSIKKIIQNKMEKGETQERKRVKSILNRNNENVKFSFSKCVCVYVKEDKCVRFSRGEIVSL